MAERDQVNIHQTLHGYHEGHKLLATSVELNASEKAILSQLSDSSGTGKEKNFTTYLTGYPLPNSRFYAFARTWYAEEMPRPGCVWTHTLLIDISTIWMIKNPETLLGFFKRPNPNIYSTYNISINIDIESRLKKVDEKFFKLTCLYYSEEKKVVIPSDSSQEFEAAILDIWNFQWPKLKRNFSFCTGSLSLRKLGNEIFDLQIIPQSRERSLNRHDKSMYQLLDFAESPCKFDWYANYREIELESMLDFMTLYGAELSPIKSRFPAMVQGYGIIKDDVPLPANRLFNFWNENFDESQEGRALKIALVENVFRKSSNERYTILSRLLEDNNWATVDWDFYKLIPFAWKSKSITENQTLKLLQRLQVRDVHFSKILIDISPSVWLEHLDLYSNSIPELITRIDVLSLSEFWNSPRLVQEAWWGFVQDSVLHRYSEVIFMMLNHRNGTFAQDVLKLCGDKTFEALFNWMLRSKEEPLPEWQYLVVLNPIGAFKQLGSLPHVNSTIIALFLENVSPTLPDWRKIPLKTFTRFFEHVEQLENPVLKTGIYTYFLTSCLTGNITKSELLVEQIFQRLHDYLENDICERDSWQRFKMELGRDLYGLLELDFFSKHFKDRQEVPDWDRCEFLRRSLLSSFLKFDWDITLIIYIVNNENTFEKIVNFGVDVKPVKKLLKNLKKILESEKVVHNKYFKILKRAL